MPQFSYKARDAAGALVEGSMEAPARAAVATKLQQMGCYPIAIAESGGGKSSPIAARTGLFKGIAPGGPAKAESPPRPAKVRASRSRIKAADLATFNRQLADLIGAGVPLVKGIGILAKQTPNLQLRAVADTILSDVQGGLTFADALGRHPGVFSKLFVAMVKSGEAGGMLGEVLQRLADFSESEEQLRGRIKSVLAYPVIMVLASIAAIFVMFTYVIPKIVDTFKQMEQALPTMTLALIAVSDFIQAYWPIMVGGAAVGGVALWRFAHTGPGRLLLHRALLRIPIVSDVIGKREVARFSRTLGSLLKNGVSILGALDIVKEVLSNVVFRAEVERITDEIKQGSPVAEPLRRSNVFPPVAVNMIATGEETGRLPEVLLRISESYEAEVERQVRTLTSLIEPIIIVVMGVVIGFLVISMLLPIFTLDPTGGE